MFAYSPNGKVKKMKKKNWSLSISRHHAIQCAITRDFQAKNKEIAKSLIFFEHAFFSGAELSAVRDCAKSDLRQRVTRLASSCRQVTHSSIYIANSWYASQIEEMSTLTPKGIVFYVTLMFIVFYVRVHEYILLFYSLPFS